MGEICTYTIVFNNGNVKENVPYIEAITAILNDVTVYKVQATDSTFITFSRPVFNRKTKSEKERMMDGLKQLLNSSRRV